MGQHTTKTPQASDVVSFASKLFRAVSSFVMRNRSSIGWRTTSRARESNLSTAVPVQDAEREKLFMFSAKAYYRRHRAELVNKFGPSCYVAIRGDQIVDFDGEFRELARRISQSFSGLSVYVVNTDDEPGPRRFQVDSPELT